MDEQGPTRHWEKWRGLFCVRVSIFPKGRNYYGCGDVNLLGVACQKLWEIGLLAVYEIIQNLVPA